jgi:hypothetical protein
MLTVMVGAEQQFRFQGEPGYVRRVRNNNPVPGLGAAAVAHLTANYLGQRGSGNRGLLARPARLPAHDAHAFLSDNAEAPEHAAEDDDPEQGITYFA